MYPVIDDVCEKMTNFVRKQIDKKNPDGEDAKEVLF